ncbi:WRKY domain containing protein [Parasponia andersonii]|uniref:WRKY domain containing protein n=1 Tax=Parasponia andersonii TaxID=3476 RepID=A0A2P5C6Y2_PARAD|nr:WRKY domain containing protein [Parasponia andersonii]
MAVDLLGFSKIEDHAAVQEAASAGLKSMEHLIRDLSGTHSSGAGSGSETLTLGHLDFREATDFTVARFKQVISILNRTGHARFRRGPSSNALAESRPDDQNPVLDEVIRVKYSSKASFSTESRSEFSASQNSKDCLTLSPPMSSNTSTSLVSSVTGDGSVSNGKIGTLLFPPPVPAVSAGKPPLASRKRYNDSVFSGDVTGKTSSASCHCHKRRKNRFKKSIRVPAISSKIADIPQDEYSWRKYGQKPIKGSPFPRGYYKCSSVKGCPARKHVERARDDPTMLIVTYEWEHRHSTMPVTENVRDGVVRGLGFQPTR